MTSLAQRVDDPARGIAYMVATAVVLFPALNAMVKYLLADYSVVQVIWVRSVVHFAWMVALFMPGMGLALFRSARPGLQLGRSCLQLISLILFVVPLSFLPLTTITTTFFTAPLMVVALSVPLLGEKVGIRRWVAVVIGFAGALVIIRPGADATHWSILLVLGSAASYALFQIVTRRVVVYDDDRTTAVYTIVAALAISTVAVPFYWETPTGVVDWAVFVGIGIMGGLGHLCVIKAYQYGQASVVGPFDYGQLVGATIIGYIVFADFPDAWTWVGAAIIVGSGLYIARREASLKKQAAGAGGPAGPPT